MGEYIHQKIAQTPNWKVAKIDCDDESNKDIATSHKVSGIPAVFLYNKGKIIDRKK